MLKKKRRLVETTPGLGHSRASARNEREIAANEPITLGADVGGKDAYHATHVHILALRRSLREQCRGPYSRVVKEYALILRIDGSVKAWKKSGVESVVLRGRNAVAEIFVPKEKWRNPSVFRDFLIGEVPCAIDRIVEVAKQRNVGISVEALLHDVGAAIRGFKNAPKS